MDIVVKEGCPKFNPQPGRGLNQGPPGWQSEILPTVLTLHTLLNGKTPGAPLTIVNDRGVGGGGGSNRGSYFIPKKNPNFRICLPKKITTFFSIPKKIP